LDCEGSRENATKADVEALHAVLEAPTVVAKVERDLLRGGAECRLTLWRALFRDCCPLSMVQKQHAMKPPAVRRPVWLTDANCNRFAPTVGDSIYHYGLPPAPPTHGDLHFRDHDELPPVPERLALTAATSQTRIRWLPPVNSSTSLDQFSYIVQQPQYSGAQFAVAQQQEQRRHNQQYQYYSKTEDGNRDATTGGKVGKYFFYDYVVCMCNRCQCYYYNL
jgi:hypothetical protein